MIDQHSINTEPLSAAKLLHLTAASVSTYLLNNTVMAEELPALIQKFYATVAGTISNQTICVKEPAVPIEESVTDDYIVCLEDGQKLKMLKRYLRTTHNMTPDEYRARWGLKADYPMVAPNYAQKRSGIAKEFGLGRYNPQQRKAA